MRSLWTLIKLGVLIGLAAWLSLQPGRSQITWLGYELEVQTGILICVALLCAFVLAQLLQFWSYIKAAPRKIGQHFEARAQDQALQAVSYGLSALAAGDADKAAHYTEKARKNMQNDHGLVPLLTGMTARLKGDKIAAENAFRDLLKAPETAFIGVRGLLQGALERGQIDQALVLARQAHRMHTKHVWILETLYQLELREKNWAEATPLLAKLIKLKRRTIESARSDKAAMAYTRALDAKAAGQHDQAAFLYKDAYSQSPAFLPAALAYIDLLKARGQTGSAIKLTERTWKDAPHPDLFTLWLALAPTKATDAKLLAWTERLTRQNPTHPQSHMILAEAYSARGLWGEADKNFRAAEKQAPTQALYQAWAKSYEKRGQTEDAQHKRDLARAAAPDKTWVCTDTGRVFAAWVPFADAQTRFNSVVWADPAQRGQTQSAALLDGHDDFLGLLEAKAV